MTPLSPIYISLADAAAVLGVSKSQVRKLVHAGDLKHSAIGRRWVFRPAWLEDFADRNDGARSDHVHANAQSRRAGASRPRTQAARADGLHEALSAEIGRPVVHRRSGS